MNARINAPEYAEDQPRFTFRRIMGLACIAGVAYVWANALLFQPGPHPAPMFADGETTGTNAEETSREFLQPASYDIPLSRLSEDARRQLITDLQESLKTLGYYTGDVDGLDGPMTRSAVSAFETANSLTPTGQPSYRLYKHARAAAADHSRMVPNGAAQAEGGKVLSVQRVLADLGYGPGPVDGAFGEATAAAIKRFEADRGMPVTGELSDTVIRELTAVSGIRIDPAG